MKSPNPAGRPKGGSSSARAKWLEYKDMARKAVPRSIEVLCEIRDDVGAKPSERATACSLLLVHAWGRPSTAEVPAEEALNMDQMSDAERITIFRKALAQLEAKQIREGAVVHEGHA